MISKVFQKSITAVYVSLLLAGIFFVFELAALVLGKSESYYFGMSIIIGMYALVGNMIVGAPVSLLSDVLTKRANRYRFILAGVLHIVLAAATVFFLQWMAFYSLACGVLFFLVDEWRTRKNGARWRQINRAAIVNTIIILGVSALSYYGVYAIVDSEVLEEKTHQTYMIPEGYEGKVLIVHEMKGVPDPKIMDGYTVVEINALGYGTTPGPMSEGFIEDKYYYVAQDGKKTRIDETCINIDGSEGTQGDGYHYDSTVFYVTKSFCGKSFQEGQGETFYPEEMSLTEVLYHEGIVSEDEY
ncbi:DUF6843 domain-containing protein [Fictibacillus iocasae]|uniref:DUF6843 domain-containing protein n=1 Tax=Fictibacillus iocasae TaxID=2715437 RepID=A0ABW2NUD1_9BACL